MTTSNTTSTSSAFSLPAGAPSAAKATLKLLLRLKHGTLMVKLPDGSVQRFGNGQGPQASLHLLNWNVCSAALKSGDIGFAPPMEHLKINRKVNHQLTNNLFLI